MGFVVMASKGHCRIRRGFVWNTQVESDDLRQTSRYHTREALTSKTSIRDRPSALTLRNPEAFVFQEVPSTQ